jgi:type VI secretion system secreted protein VgrG
MTDSGTVQSSFSVTTPFTQNQISILSFHGEEALSNLFFLEVQLRADSDSLDFSQILGKPAYITAQIPGGSQQYTHGIVTQFSQLDKNERYTRYVAHLRPWLWLLTLNSDNKIYQNMTVPQIIEQVFSNLGFSDYKNSLTKTYSQREYCVQYGESTYNFLARLMESEGVFYYFEHSDQAHTLVLADSTDAYASLPGITSIRYQQTERDWSSIDALTAGAIAERIVPGKLAMDDYNFETPATDLYTTVTGSTTQCSLYEYPGKYKTSGDGESQASLRIAAYEADQKLLSGRSQCSAFHAGCQFTLAGHYLASANAQYVLRSVRHAYDGEHYSNEFDALPSTVSFVPARVTPQPKIYGAQTALVVGKSGEEIWTDQYGRIKVKFYWDQSTATDETCSCWIRVAQMWAGKQWGSLYIPRIGQEVVVSFLDGDPDRPLVMGSVYNADQTVPYTLPDDQTKSTVKSNSSKGGSGFNEIRFEDKSGSEELFIQAQKDMNVTVLNDQTVTVTNNRTVTVSEKDETLTVSKGNRTVAVSTGNETHTVKGTRDLTITGNESHTNSADYKQTVSGNFTLKVSGDLTIDVSGAVTIKSGTSLSIKSGTSLAIESGTDLSNKAGTSMSNEAQTTLTSKANASHSVQSSGELEIKGSLVKIN